MDDLETPCQTAVMNLEDLHAVIAGSNPSDWHRISDGPFFRHVAYHGDDNYYSEHYYRAVLTENLAVALEWGLPRRDAESETGHLWAKQNGSFPDPHVHGIWIDVLYNGELVDRALAYSVDGGRGYLPTYEQKRIDGGDPDDFTSAKWAFQVDDWRYVLTRLVDHLSNTGDFDSYFARAGFERR